MDRREAHIRRDRCTRASDCASSSITALQAVRSSAGHLLNQSVCGRWPGHLRKPMQDHSIARPVRAQPPLYPSPLAKNAPERSAPFGKPEPTGLTRAQLRDIIIEQLG